MMSPSTELVLSGIRSHFNTPDYSDVTVFDVILIATKLFANHAAPIGAVGEFFIDVAAREDNPCWLPQHTFHQLQNLVAHCGPDTIDGFVSGIQRLSKRTEIRWSPYSVAHL